MNLPSKDKKGNDYLSYSQINTFKRSKDDYYNIYILKKPFEGNEYTDFGNKVGKALETNDFTGFKSKECKTLTQVTRLDQFERAIFLRYEGFYLIGYIDSISKDMKSIIDYKTGGYRKEFQYMDVDYNQLHTYVLGIRQETGVRVKEASVEFIRRAGNAYKGQILSVADEQPIIIYQDLKEERLKRVYYDILKTAKEISKFYKENK